EQNADNYYHFFPLPNNGAWYSFDWANAHFICLDSNQELGEDTEQYRWLEKDVAASRAEWKVVFFHHPLFSAHPTRPINANRWSWQPLFQRMGVPVVLTGHDHFYERCLPIGSATAATPETTWQFTTGGGGAPLYPIEPRIYTAVAQSVHHYVIFDF